MFSLKVILLLFAESLSQDDKARVPIGLPAARKQAPLLTHLDYKNYITRS
jgi:hypothetical protein